MAADSHPDKRPPETDVEERFSKPTEGDEDYGADTWQAISARLAESDARPTGLLESLRNVLARPRFNLAGVAAVAFVAVLAFLLGHTSGNTDNQPLFILLHLCQPSYKAKGLLLGFGSDGAGVDDDVVGRFEIVSDFHSLLLQLALECGGLKLVDFAAKGAQIGLFHYSEQFRKRLFQRILSPGYGGRARHTGPGLWPAVAGQIQLR